MSANRYVIAATRVSGKVFWTGQTWYFDRSRAQRYYGERHVETTMSILTARSWGFPIKAIHAEFA